MTDNIQELCIIPSGKPKIWDKYPHLNHILAKEAYIGTFHRLCQAYAKQFYGNWVIISPKYGILLPNQFVEGSYDLSFSQIHKNKDIISIPYMRKQLKDNNLFNVPKVTMLGGKKFKPILEMLFPNDVSLSFPLHGTRGIGDMQKRLKDAMEVNKKL
ncbi:hypothetical protein HNQ94_002306 [Salirhabdus euzebyi]|uniref:DUF6884 domain-containing protein n=1 Tax=Salirhabdus euzebyi TaxID=394506 RepID=A0A841Q654_9BACI|nr:DUF6884 domain-containing protein [Salirhabdus euzebyi]MBB6453855.1 hypothetical protein [Salirhabdus euzebyi]